MLEQQISALQADAQQRIARARSLEELEPVRIDTLGRKGGLAQISKDMGKLEPQERARVGKLLNAVKQELEGALERRKQEFEEAAKEHAARGEYSEATKESERAAEESRKAEKEKQNSKEEEKKGNEDFEKAKSEIARKFPLGKIAKTT